MVACLGVCDVMTHIRYGVRTYMRSVLSQRSLPLVRRPPLSLTKLFLYSFFASIQEMLISHTLIYIT